MIKKVIWITIKSICLIILFYVAFIYINCPVYKFPDHKPFRGNFFYNPYKGLNNSYWKKINFHVHSKAWGGLTNGRKNSNDDIFHVYHDLGYDLVTISDYQKINKSYSEGLINIPTYEHGYGIYKHHYLCIGANKVLWLDYPFCLDINNKQYIINRLKEYTDVVAIAHPKLRHAFSAEDFTKLTGYDLIEIGNNQVNSTELWDAALSAGMPVFSIADDDAHDVRNPNDVGRNYNMIYSNKMDRESIVKALKKGNSYAVSVFKPQGERIEAKKKRHKNIPSLISITLDDNVMTVNISGNVDEFLFIGIHGDTLAMQKSEFSASYPITKNDSYVRAEALLKDSSKMYFNPVIRSDNGLPAKMKPAVIDDVKTFEQRAVWWSLIVIITGLYIGRKRIKAVFKKKKD